MEILQIIIFYLSVNKTDIASAFMKFTVLKKHQMKEAEKNVFNQKCLSD